jgi:excisionase family DNA binding protein
MPGVLLAKEIRMTQRLAYSIKEASEALGLSRDSINDLIRTAELPSVKVGRRRLIPAAALHQLLDPQAA